MLSALALLPVLLMIFKAVQAYQYRHYENMLKEPPLRRFLVMKTQKSEYTYSTEYMNEFSLMFAIYVGVMPFQLSVFTFFAPEFQFLMSFFVFMVPYIFYFVIWIYKLIKKCNELKQQKSKSENERLEQEIKEEQGYWR